MRKEKEKKKKKNKNPAFGLEMYKSEGWKYIYHHGRSSHFLVLEFVFKQKLAKRNEI